MKPGSDDPEAELASIDFFGRPRPAPFKDEEDDDGPRDGIDEDEGEDHVKKEEGIQADERGAGEDQTMESNVKSEVKQEDATSLAVYDSHSAPTTQGLAGLAPSHRPFASSAFSNDARPVAVH